MAVSILAYSRFTGNRFFELFFLSFGITTPFSRIRSFICIFEGHLLFIRTVVPKAIEDIFPTLIGTHKFAILRSLLPMFPEIEVP